MTVNKWLVLVRLLLGEIPEHLEFTQQGMRKPLQAYYELTQAVREGDLTLFRSVLLPQQYITVVVCYELTQAVEKKPAPSSGHSSLP